MTLVKFLPGDGTECQVKVKYIADGFARDAKGFCAYCHGDDDNLTDYFKRNSWAAACPMCEGRPS